MEKRIFTSDGQLKVGDEGEMAVLGFLESMETVKGVVLLKDNRYKHLRKYDIDYVVSPDSEIDDNVLINGDIDEINGKYVTVELKTDTRISETRNMFLEEELVRCRDGFRIDGYMRKCRAKLLFYYDKVGGKLYSGLFSELKRFYDANRDRMRRVTVFSEIVGSREKCRVTGYLYNIDEAVKNGLMREFTSF